ncbi:hypothetical protein MANES_11G110600v8 [Manihot esculenta]|uniref:Uncharacterized protein n=1 Tax=Manihot esculenta TaxID=3983 RepID=A0ACB7GVJ2_MANES|nr:hypothetical protein MANES_11G110600v8 [Manihot esculenta]
MRFPTILSNSKLSNWILRIKEASSNGNFHEVISHYIQLKIAGPLPVYDSLFPPILKAFSYVSPKHGRAVHACLIKRGFESFTSIGNSIMSFYVKCADMDAARSGFDSMRCRDSVSWNILVHGFLDHGALVEGLWHFTSAKVAGFEPNISTLVLVIQACRNLSAKFEGLQLHCYLIQSGHCTISSIQNSLLCMYADDDMECARNMFDEMREKDVISWSVMIGGYVRSLEAQTGLQMFQEMVSNPAIEPDEVTMEMSRRNDVSWNCMISGLVLNENYSEALSVISSMQQEGTEADEVTLVNILQICKYFAHPYQCKAVHCVIIRHGCESNELLHNSLIDAYAKCKLIEHAWEVFIGMRRRDVVVWSTMIAGFAYCGMPDKAISVFQEMNKSTEIPNAVTIMNLLEACSVSADLNRSKWAHGVAVRRGLAVEVTVGTAIVVMYSKCGEIEASRKAFNQIRQKNIVTWSAMIASYGRNGLAHEALALLDEMKLHGLKPNALTIVSVLAACSHCGLVEEGLSIFKSMVEDHGLEPVSEHYSCIVGLLGRAGELDSAMELIKMMPESSKAGASVWGALLSACRNYGNTKLGREAASCVLELEPLNSAGYLLASSMFAADGLWVDATRMRLLAEERGKEATAGYSLIHADSKAS